MTYQLLDSLLNPPLLFFFLGLFAVLVRSELEVPQSIAKFLSLYLLMSIGIQGGHELFCNPINGDVYTALVLCGFMSIFVPLYSFFLWRIRLDSANAAALSATYGSISAITFITAVSYLDRLGISFGGHMIASMALMESPAIVIGVFLYRFFQNKSEGNRSSLSSRSSMWKNLLHDAFLNGSVLLMLGSFCIGMVLSFERYDSVSPFTKGIFPGMLMFFLLDMGLIAGKRLGDLKKVGFFLIAFGLLITLINASIAIALAYCFGLSMGNAMLFTVLCASASYLAVPAAMRIAIPAANPSVYVSVSLAVTFPFNLLIGIPLYLSCIQYFWN